MGTHRIGLLSLTVNVSSSQFGETASQDFRSFTIELNDKSIFQYDNIKKTFEVHQYQTIKCLSSA